MVWPLRSAAVMTIESRTIATLAGSTACGGREFLLRLPRSLDQGLGLYWLFEKVFVPVAVHEELTDSRTPETVRGRVLAMPAWFEVRTVQETQATTFPVTLHRGERQAILLAEALRADVPLSRNLPLSGTLGVLERADSMGFVSDFQQLLQRLKASGFFLKRDALRDAAAHRFGDMKVRNGPRAILEGYRDFLAFSTLRTCAILIVSACLWWI
jgi:predicted nucleic acid-binding protein